MTFIERNRLSGAVTECVARCRNSKQPVADLAAFIQTLRVEKWPEADIHAVERAVLRLLASVIAPSGGGQQADAA
jgi:hypothetical protein